MKRRSKIPFIMVAFMLLAGVFALPHDGRAAAAIDAFNPDVVCVPGAEELCILTVAEQADGKVLLGGNFSAGNGAFVNIARLNPDGTVDRSFKLIVADFLVGQIIVQPTDQKIIIGGHFTTLTELGTGPTTTRNHIARLNADGSVDQDFDPNADAEITALALQADGKILVGGNFGNMGNSQHPFFVRLHSEGTGTAGAVDDTFTANVSNTVRSIVVLPDDRILIGGNFYKANCSSYTLDTTTNTYACSGGTEVNYIARLTSSGSVDASFANAGLVQGVEPPVNALAVQPSDGKILVGGSFTIVGSGAATTTRNNILRLNADGTLDPAFDPGADGVVNAIALQADGMIITGGTFTHMGGQVENCISRLTSTGAVDPGFVANFDNTITALGLQTDGMIITGGTFTTIVSDTTTTTRSHMARLYDSETSTSVSSDFNPSSYGSPITFTARVTSSAGSPTGTVTFKDNGAALPSGTVTLANGTAVLTTWLLSAGEHSMTAEYSGNAAFTASYSSAAPVTVRKAVLTVTADDASRVYGFPDPLFTAKYTGFVNGDTAAVLTGSPSLMTAATSTSPAGVYPVTPSLGSLAAADYDFHFVNGALTVTHADQTIIFNPLPIKTYGDADFGPNATTTSGLEASYTSSDPAVATIIGNKIHIVSAGTTTITANQGGNGNYSAAVSVQHLLTVNKATVIVTADNKSRSYGVENPALTFTFSGFVNNDAEAVVTGAPVLATSATTTSPKGSYPITVALGSLTAANYSFSPVNGTLGIDMATQTIAFPAPAPRIYGDASFTLSAAASSGLPVSFTSSNPAVAVVSGTTTTFVTIMSAGTATITATQAGDADTYAPAVVVQTLIVAKATVTVTADNANRAFGSANPAFTFTYNGFVNNETAELVGGAPSFTTSATIASPAGSYPIIPSSGTLSAANYSFSFVPGTLTVVPTTQTITFGPLSARTYGDADFGPGASASSGLPVLYTSSDLSVATIVGSSIHILSAGTATITASQSGNANYLAATVVSRVLTINRLLTSTMLASDKNPSAVNGYVTFSAAVNAAGATGTVTFKDGVNTLSTVTLSGGTAIYTTAALVLGQHSVSASYNGDGNFLPSTSPVLVQTTVQFASTTSLSSSANPAAYSGSVTFTAAVSGAGATGTVTFLDNGIALPSGTVALTNGTAVYTTSALGAGTHTITAPYSGDASYGVSTSSILSQDVRYADGNFNGGNVDMTDALKALRFAAGLDIPSALDTDHGDVAPLVNGKPRPDGKIDMSDVVVILRKAAGLVSW